MVDQADMAVTGLPPASTAVSAGTRVVSVEEARIVATVIEHLGVLVGISSSAQVADFVLRTLTPSANRMSEALRAAGYSLDREGQA